MSVGSPSEMTGAASPVSRFISKGKGTINRYGLDLEFPRERKGQKESCSKGWEVRRGGVENSWLTGFQIDEGLRKAWRFVPFYLLVFHTYSREEAGFRKRLNLMSI